MIEKENDFCCQNKHGQPIQLVVLDSKIEKKQRLVCNQCMENFQSDCKTIGFKNIIQNIEDVIKNNINTLEDINSDTIQKIQMCITSTQELKTSFMKLFDSIIRLAEDWTQNLLAQSQQFNQYSFYDELDNFINKQNNHYNSNISLINNINRTWMTKLQNILIQYNQNKDQLNFKAIRQHIINICQSNFSQKQSKIKLNLIDNSVIQYDACGAIVFDSSGSIMLSTEIYNIKVWRFLNGTIQLVITLQGHTDWIQCLVYSSKYNSFISCSSDKTIRCWQQLNETDWICSQAYQQHSHYVNCIILNSNEDLLFSGSSDKSIKVWKVDFNQNQLKFLYSLDKHYSIVWSLSLNQSENQLVSCAQDKNQIIIWERREKDKYEFKYYVTQSIDYCSGLKVKFIKENEFIWITDGDQIDKLCVFELKEGVFQENQEKTIQLIANNKVNDENRFPIIYNKERNLIVVRHKTYIYIIRQIKDGKYKIDDQLNCNTFQIYGTITNDGQYLVYWDDINQGYSIYQLLNK